MSEDTKTFNATSFERYFASGRLNFANWLEEFFKTGVAAPFSFPTRTQYDLGDLLDDLLFHSRGKDEWVLVIENAFKDVLLRIPHNFNLRKLSEISDAAARAGFSEIARALALAVGAIVENATLRPIGDQDGLGSLIMALDKTIASISKLAIDEVGKKSAVLDACTELFNIDDLALFSSSLFAPLALSRIDHWPRLWAELEQKAQTRIDIWAIDPSISGFKSIVSTSNGSAIATYFDLGHVMRDFIAQSIRKGIELSALFMFAQSAESPAARVAVQELFQYGRRKCLAMTSSADFETSYIWVEPGFAKSYGVKKYCEPIGSLQDLTILADVMEASFQASVEAVRNVSGPNRSASLKQLLVDAISERNLPP
jgi:hypothetical protein